ncbi:MAG: ABC transporter substrate-binding protein [Chloroflexi bacterium]|nr:ABC transporter substrate-binding protein [Chloroflexota bacterium]
MITRFRLLTLVSLMTIVGLVIVACGGGDDDEPTVGPTATPQIVIATPTPAPTRPPGPTNTPVVVVQTATPTPQPGLGAQTDAIKGFRWIQNQPNWKAAPRRGGTHTYANSAQPASLDPVLSRSFTTMAATTPVYSQLVRCAVAPNQKVGDISTCTPEADVAASWSQTGNGKVWTFKLNPNAAWQSPAASAFGYDAKLAPLYGRKFVADDAVHSINYWLGRLKKADGSPQPTVTQGPHWSNIDTLRAVDSATLEVTVKAADPYFPNSLADFQSRLVPPEVFALDGDYTKRAVGSGALIMDKFDRPVRTEFVANTKFWKNGADGKPLPYIDRHNLVILTATLARSALITGQVDSALSIGLVTPADAVNFGRQCQSCQIVEMFSAKSIYGLGFKTDGAGAAFADIRSRIAIGKAVDWQGIINNVFTGAGRLVPNTVSTGIMYDENPALAKFAEGFANDDENPWVFNPAKAKELWVASGRRLGETVNLIFNPYTNLPNTVLAVVGDIEKNLGISIKVNQVSDINVYYAAVGYNPGQPHQNFDGLTVYFTQPLATAAQDLVTLTRSNAANFMEYNNARIDDLAAEAARGVTDERMRQIALEVWSLEKKELKRLPLPEPARYITYSGRLRNSYQQSAGGEAFHQGGHLAEVIWLAS